MISLTGKKYRSPLVFAGACVTVIMLSVFVGPRMVFPLGMDETTRQIIMAIRLPRVVVAVLMGAALGASGAVLQGILRNPLADPYILGISTGAALSAALGLMLGQAMLGPLSLPLTAFAGAVVTGLAVGALGHRRGTMLPERLLLAGVGLGFLFSALLMLVMTLSSDEGLRRAMLWIFGDLSMADWTLIPWGALCIASGLGVTIWRVRGLNALALGDDIAHSLGFSPSRERLLLFAAVGLMTAAAVSLGGIVGFVGLLVPHIIRFIGGSDGRVLVPLSSLAGAALLVMADTIGRTLTSPVELPAGIVTAILGAPYFLYLLRRRDILGS